MAWYRCSNNLGTYNKYEIDNTTLINNTYINENNGTEVSATGWSATDFLTVRGNSLVFIGNILNYGTNIYNAFYDENKDYVSRLTLPRIADSGTPIVIPSTAKYMRISCQTTLFITNIYFMGTDN